MLKKIFRKRRADVSLLKFSKIIFSLIFEKFLWRMKGSHTIKRSCLIIFPPSLGLGDLIILSRIVEIINSSNKYDYVSVGHFAPYLQKRFHQNEFINLQNIEGIFKFENFIFPSPSFLNLFFYYLLGKEKFIGYLNKPYVNFKDKNNYIIDYYDPYYFRLIPFKNYFKYPKEIIPFIWGEKERKELKLEKDFIDIRQVIPDKIKNIKFDYLVLSTYNFYHKFRPSIEIIIDEIIKITSSYEKFHILILGANAKKELLYNKNLESILKKHFKNTEIVNLTGMLNIKNSLELISQSSHYLGANNGLANVAQMIGIQSTLIFNGPEDPDKRKFSKFAKFKRVN